MNEYKYAEITIGQEEKFSVVLTQDKMDKFRDITGDINPLHNDEKFALQGGTRGALPTACWSPRSTQRWLVCTYPVNGRLFMT